MATVAKAKHREARSLYLKHLDLHPGRVVGDDLDPLEAGIVGDPDHDGGYHISRQDNDADDYSVDESIRDRRGRSDTASAMDIGFFQVKTRKGTFDLYDYNVWLVGLCKAGDPDTADLREVIYSLDGRTVRRWDRLGKRSTGDSSHRTHTHLSEHRDASGQRMVNLARRWLQHIGLLAGEEDDMSAADAQQGFYLAVMEAANPPAGDAGRRGRQTRDALRAIVGMEATSPAELQAVLDGKDWTNEPEIVAGVLAGLSPESIAAAIPLDLADRVADELARRLATPAG